MATAMKISLKSEFVLLQIIRAYSISFSSSNVGNFFWSWNLQFRKRKRKSLSWVHVLHKMWNLAFSGRSHAMTAKKCIKKRDACAELLFCQSKPTTFLPFWLTTPSSLLKLPMVRRKLMLITLETVHVMGYSSKWPNRSHGLYMCDSLCYIPGGRGAFFWINTTATLVFWSCRLLLLRKRTRVN